MMGYSEGIIRNIWSSIEDRHRTYGHASPLGEPGSFSEEVSGRLARYEANQPSSSSRPATSRFMPCFALSASRGLAQRSAHFDRFLDRNHHVRTSSPSQILARAVKRTSRSAKAREATRY